MRWQPTVQGWQNLVLSIMGVVVFGGAVAGTVLLNRTDNTSRELIDIIQPARVAAYQLQGSLLDQETAVRGYAIAADPQFLAPYDDGQSREKAAVQEIRERIGNRSELVEDLDNIEQAAAEWRISYAEPLIASVTPGSPNLLDATTAERGKAQFDGLRRLFDAQNEHLSQARLDGIGAA